MSRRNEKSFHVKNYKSALAFNGSKAKKSTTDHIRLINNGPSSVKNFTRNSLTLQGFQQFAFKKSRIVPQV